MRKLFFSVALLLTVSSSKADPINNSVVLVGTNANILLNTPQLILDGGTFNRNWAEIVVNDGTNYILVCDGPIMFQATNVVNGTTHITWAGTLLLPGGSYTVRPFGSQSINAGAWRVWGVVQGIGTNVVGTRDARR